MHCSFKSIFVTGCNGTGYIFFRHWKIAKMTFGSPKRAGCWISIFTIVIKPVATRKIRMPWVWCVWPTSAKETQRINPA